MALIIDATVAVIRPSCVSRSVTWIDNTVLPGCRKLYVPLDGEGASAAPFGFVLQAVQTDEGLAWGFLAFGERHPENPATRTVYERAHKRIHGRYP